MFLLVLLTVSSCTNDSSNDDGFGPAEVPLAALKEVRDAQGNTYQVGHDQVSANNQNPFVVKKAPNGTVLWRVAHESTPVDGRAYLVNVDQQGNPWVVFSVDGGSNSNDYITKKHIAPGAFDGVFLNSFGRASGAAKVAVLARLDAEDGKIVKATFLMSRTQEGNINNTEKTNSFEATKLGFAQDGGVLIEGNSWFKPPAEDATQGNFKHHAEATDTNKQGSHWVMQLKLPFTLARLTKSSVVK